MTEVETLEAEFAELHGMKHAIAVSEGANAIMVAALKNAGMIKPGDKAVVPAIASSALYEPLVKVGLELLLGDTDDTWNMASIPITYPEPDSVKPSLIVGCSTLGNPGHLAWLAKISDEIGAVFVEDNSDGLGAWSVGRAPVTERRARISSKTTPNFKRCGTFGSISTFSIGDIGVILTNDDMLAYPCRGFRTMPSEESAAKAREQLAALTESVRQRTQNYNNFETWAIGLGDKIKMPRKNGVISPRIIHFEVKDFAARHNLVLALRGVDECDRIYAPAGDQQPRAAQIRERGMMIANPPVPCDDMLQKVLDIMEKTL